MFQINSFDGALNSARKLALTATTGVEEVKTSLHQLELRSNETIANVSTNAKKDDDLKEQVATLNATLLSKVNSLETRIEEINVSHFHCPCPYGASVVCAVLPYITNNSHIGIHYLNHVLSS